MSKYYIKEINKCAECPNLFQQETFVTACHLDNSIEIKDHRKAPPESCPLDNNYQPDKTSFLFDMLETHINTLSDEKEISVRKEIIEFMKSELIE